MAGRADMVIGDRGVHVIEHFSPTKKRLQRIGSWVVRQASGTDVPDATSGFRAYNREAALGLTVVSTFTYTLESLIQAGKSLVAVDHVPVGTNAKTRESRLFGSMSLVRAPQHAGDLPHLHRLRAAAGVRRCWPRVLAVGGVVAWAPFLWDWVVHGDRSGHLQSIVLGGVLLVAAVQIMALGVLADLLASHRVVSQRTLERVRRIELELGIPPSHYVSPPPASDREAAEASSPTPRIESSWSPPCRWRATPTDPPRAPVGRRPARRVAARRCHGAVSASPSTSASRNTSRLPTAIVAPRPAGRPADATNTASRTPAPAGTGHGDEPRGPRQGRGDADAQHRAGRGAGRGRRTTSPPR